ncbi:hypothetical protein E2C01_017446 [Portunus trituberculatus]|uniref:Uncharacterized protein n=1 Tax=Portunus trituberculatus TaxID=210409 RepID=A0A5B7DSW2_PORTR|nr:hypothetical protein [Portunus trituberculatus]
MVVGRSSDSVCARSYERIIARSFESVININSLDCLHEPKNRQRAKRCIGLARNSSSGARFICSTSSQRRRSITIPHPKYIIVAPEN